MNQENATYDVIIESSDLVNDQQNPESGASSASAQTDVTTENDNVNWKNKFYETDRKLSNLTKSIPQMIQEAAQSAAQQAQVKPSQPEYSVQDYLRAKAQDPVNAAYYDAQIIELQNKNIEKTVSSQLSALESRRQEEQARIQAENWALTNFPQLRDPSNAFSQQVWNVFNSRPASKREPHDFAIAAELVANRMGVKPATLTNTQQDAIQQKERQLKKLTRERAIEGDGRVSSGNIQVSTKIRERDEALQSGNIRDYIQKHWIKPREAEE